MAASQSYAKAQTDDPANREKDDFYPTHPGATAALLSAERFGPVIWEPACGEGDISRVLEAAGKTVISHDLVDRGYGIARRDFLFERALHAPDIITNPPFKLALPFCQHALDLGAAKVAMFLRLAFLEGVERKAFFERNPPARVWVMSRRVPMQRGRLARAGDGHGVMAFAWFVWERGHLGPAEIGFLDWKDAASSEPAAGQMGEAA